MELMIGRILKAHGTRGECVIEIHTDDPDQRFVPHRSVHLRTAQGDRYQYRIHTVRPHGARLLVRFEEITTRSDSEALRGSTLVIHTDELPPLMEDDTYYDYQLEGLQVRTREGQSLGTVQEVLHTGAGELLSVPTDEGREILIPFVKDIVPTVCLSEGFLIIDPPDGLLN